MTITRYLDLDCVSLSNESLSLLVTQSVGPRIISLRFRGGDNLFAELPDFTVTRPDGLLFHFYGGHRLWQAPEDIWSTYAPDDSPVSISQTANKLLVTQAASPETGIEKSIRISLVDDKPQVVLTHALTNHGPAAVECAPWAITQFKTGGVAILPQSRQQTEVLPNRSLALWPYTDIANRNVHWGNGYILVRAEMQEEIFKVGFPNRRGWLACWQTGTLFLKRAAFDPQARYYDFNSSSECYCNNSFLELETLGPVTTLIPGASVTHTEIWELYGNVELPDTEDSTQRIVETLGLE
jgi:hypothetical protein